MGVSAAVEEGDIFLFKQIDRSISSSSYASSAGGKPCVLHKSAQLFLVNWKSKLSVFVEQSC